MRLVRLCHHAFRVVVHQVLIRQVWTGKEVYAGWTEINRGVGFCFCGLPLMYQKQKKTNTMDLLIGMSSPQQRQQQQQQRRRRVPMARSGAKITKPGPYGRLAALSASRVSKGNTQAGALLAARTRDPAGLRPLWTRDAFGVTTHAVRRNHGWTTQNVSAHIHDKAPPLDTSLAFLNAPELSQDAVPDWLADLETHVNQQIHAMSSLIRGKQQQ